MIFEITAGLFLLASLWLNYRLFTRLLFVNDEYDNVLSSIETFKEHLERLNQSETYHAEPTIERLIAHSGDVVADIENFLEGFSEEEKDA
tara:strand:- start:311 stop:580 length:270 start_codon:yes stop_codon:yes gene_type:complete